MNLGTSAEAFLLSPHEELLHEQMWNVQLYKLYWPPRDRTPNREKARRGSFREMATEHMLIVTVYPDILFEPWSSSCDCLAAIENRSWNSGLQAHLVSPSRPTALHVCNLCSTSLVRYTRPCPVNSPVALYTSRQSHLPIECFGLDSEPRRQINSKCNGNGMTNRTKDPNEEGGGHISRPLAPLLLYIGGFLGVTKVIV